MKKYLNFLEWRSKGIISESKNITLGEDEKMCSLKEEFTKAEELHRKMEMEIQKLPCRERDKINVLEVGYTFEENFNDLKNIICLHMVNFLKKWYPPVLSSLIDEERQGAL